MLKYEKPKCEIKLFPLYDCLYVSDVDNPINDPGDWFVSGN